MNFVLIISISRLVNLDIYIRYLSHIICYSSPVGIILNIFNNYNIGSSRYTKYASRQYDK